MDLFFPLFAFFSAGSAATSLKKNAAIEKKISHFPHFDPPAQQV
jgi:hypothetical protein